MALVTLTSPVQWPSFMSRVYGTMTPAVAGATMSATGHYAAYIDMAREAMSVTHFGFFTGTITGAGQVLASIETVDATTGLPTGTLISASSSVSVGSLSSSTWNLAALAGTATIPAGTLFAAVLRYEAGTSVGIVHITGLNAVALGGIPYRASSTGTPAKSTSAPAYPWCLGSSSSAFYQLDGMLPLISATAGVFTGSGATNAKALRFKVPFKCRCAGLVMYYGTTQTADFDIAILDDAGTELSSSRTTFDKDKAVTTAATHAMAYFDNPVVLSPATWYRATMFAASGGNSALNEVVMPGANYISAWSHKANAHIAYFTSSAWDDTHTEILPEIGLILDQLDDGVNTASGGVTGVVGT